MSSCVGCIFPVSQKKKKKKIKIGADWIKTDLELGKMFTEQLLVLI